MIRRSMTLLKRLGLLVALIAAMAGFQPGNASIATAGVPPTDAPAYTDKNSVREEVSDALPGSSVAASPQPGSKNSSVRSAGDGSVGTTRALPPEPGSKNHQADAEATHLRDITAEELAASGSLLTCGASSDLEWTTTSSTFEVIHQCTLTVPQDGWVFISADGSAYGGYGEYEAQFRIDIDNTGGDYDTDRWVNVYTDSGDGTDKSVALSVLKPVSPGTHTFYFLGKRWDGAGTVHLLRPTFTVILVPASHSEVRTCGAFGDLDWETTYGGYEVMRQCTLIVPQDGWVFISADGSVGLSDGEYEAQFRIDIDNTGGDYDTDRWVNVYTDTGDGTDESVALSVLKPVTTGTHTFYFLGGRYAGTGTVLVHDPTLTVLYVPSPATAAVACGASGSTAWTTTSGTFEVMRQCTLTVPQDGWVFISADGSAGGYDGEYEARFRVGIDGTGPIFDIDRWVNVYNDGGDGTDRSVALSVLKHVTAGTHTFYFLGSRYAGAGTVLVYDPTLTVIVPGAQVFLPVLLNQ